MSTPEVRETIEAVVAELDEGVRPQAERVAAEGTERAGALGLDAEPLVIRVLAPVVGTPTSGSPGPSPPQPRTTTRPSWVLGSRGRSQLEAAVLGSVSYGVLHPTRRPSLVVDEPDPDEPAAISR